MTKRVGLLIAVAGAAASVAAAWPYWWPRPADELRLHGVVQTQEVRLGSKAGGRVASVHVSEGERVEAGRVIARFEVPELTARRDQLAAKVAAAEADLQRLRNGPRPEELAEAAAAGAAAEARLQRLVAGSREEDIRLARHELAAAEADARFAQAEYERFARTFSTRAASASELDEARAERDRAAARGQAARAKLDLLANGSRAEDIAEARAELGRLKAQYERLRNGTRAEDIARAEADLAAARAERAGAEADLREAAVVAPEAAVVEVLSVRPGDLVAPNQAVARVLRADDLWVKVYVPEPQLVRVRLGDDVSVTVDAYPGRAFAGKVTQIAAESEFTPRNVQSASERRHQVFAVKVRVDDPAGVFKSGLAAEVAVPLRGADE